MASVTRIKSALGFCVVFVVLFQYLIVYVCFCLVVFVSCFLSFFLCFFRWWCLFLYVCVLYVLFLWGGGEDFLFVFCCFY